MPFKTTLKKYLKICGIFFSIFLICSTAVGQLKADFTIDKSSGCSPLTVSFTNTSTGTSFAATYKWDFNNGNTSTLKSPGATYVTEKTYNVTLTVTDGGTSSTQTKQVTVYKKPTVDFSASPAKGCLPLPVAFTSSSTAGDGTIANYFWDYGDGNTQQGTGLQQNSHTYNFAEVASVSLTVTNNYGCYNTAVKPLVEILAAIKASFTADKTVLCTTADVVTFTNTSTGPGTLSYLWDFGDGTTSANFSPSHTYSQKGVYQVKLTVSNTDGCSNTTSTQTINVANFVADFTVPSPICKGSNIVFLDKSTPGFSNEAWAVDGINTYNYYYSDLNYTFYTAGQHTIQLTTNYGTCSVVSSKTITVKDGPVIKPFSIVTPGFCSVPVTVSVKDTSAGVIGWAWSFEYSYGPVSATTASASYTYNSQGYYSIGLTVSNADGCTASESKSISIINPQVSIGLSALSNSSGCGNVTATFQASPADQIDTYQWAFGDGGTSTDAQPQHTFSTAGFFTVTLNYTTKGGCKGTAYYNSIQVFKKPVADFVSTSGTTICGNTPVSFADKSTGAVTNLIWDFGGNYTGYYNNYYNGSNPIIQYTDSGTYTIKLIAYNGTCSDTMIKTAYLKVLPPFPIIENAVNTCDDTRGLVKFTEISKYAQTWKWNFGDGVSSPEFTSKQNIVTHLYTKTGSYTAVLTTTNGQCSVNDSIPVRVLLKQSPALSSSKKEACGSDVVDVKINDLEVNPYPNYSYNYYYISTWQYGDGSSFNGNSSSNYYDWQTVYNGTLSGLSGAKQDIRAILTSSYFGCADTSNYLPLKIKGPVAGFKITANNVCYKSPIIFTDTSYGSNSVPIKKWQWNYGDGTSEALLYGGTIGHIYPDPGNYYPSLTVTDSEGCYASATYNYYINAVVNGPKAAFYFNPTTIAPNTTVYYYNNTNNYNSYNTQYTWSFSDGTSYPGYYPPSRTYPAIGTDTVKLIAKNPTTGCADTATQVIYIKNVNTAFTYNLSYINNNSCPPVIVKFRNTSVNATSVSWDFGDGSTADNQNFPSHTYLNAGVYKVTLYGYGIYGTKDSTTDSITIKGPYAKIKTDILGGCLAQTVTLSAEVKNAASFTWDFADGTLEQSKDTFARHAYLTPGLYTPSMILKDSTGCTSTSSLGDTIVIDTLNIGLHTNPNHFCDSALVTFTPDIYSLAASQMNRALSYQWDFGTGNPSDTSGSATPSFDFNKIGTYKIKVSVLSPYGCIKETEDSIVIVKRSKGSITGTTEICEGSSAQFSGAATIVNNTTLWSWDFNNGATSILQNPLSQLYKNAGTDNILLVVTNNGCSDSVYHTLLVHPKPVINLTPKQTTICLGQQVQLDAHDGTTYTWAKAAGLSNYTKASAIASPVITTNYVVTVSNAFNCSNTDSAMVIVAQPFKLSVPADTAVCEGKTVLLYTTGADTYKWINTTTSLSNTQIANPVANPKVPVTYTVVGFDNAHCFSDTATINIDVKPSPQVNAGPDVETLTGTEVLLNATGSNDIIEWSWLPADYLSCTNCSAPASTPKSEITYTVTAKNQYGCVASDNVFIKLVCTQQFVYVPTAFTPNNDGRNDVFYIMGRGVKIIRSLRIFSRWGDKIFERTNININDRTQGWDGTYNAAPAEPGSYVFMAELECDTGEVFEKKGTFVLVR